MNISLTQKHLLSAGIALIVTIIIALSFGQFRAIASAPSGLPAVVATSSQMTVNTTASLIMATSSCAARIVTTTASPVTLSFSDIQGFVPSGLQGHLQPASTTVAYDSGLYGCGAVRAYSFVAGTLTITETR